MLNPNICKLVTVTINFEYYIEETTMIQLNTQERNRLWKE